MSAGETEGSYSLAEHGKSSERVQELSAAALVEVQRRQGDGRLLEPEQQVRPALHLHRDGAQVTETEAKRPLASLMTVVHTT